MYIIAFYGILLMLLSLWMISQPQTLVEKAVAYCRSPYMHPTEIAICLGFGAPFVLFASQSQYPILLKVFGYVLVTVGVGLLFVPPSYHQRYGVWSMQKVGPYLRLFALPTLAFGAFLVYVAVAVG